MKRKLFSAVFALVMCASSSSYAQEIPNEPIAYIGHGGMFDKYGNQLLPTDGFVRSSLSFYENNLLNRLSVIERTEYYSVRSDILSQTNIDEKTRNAGLGVGISWLLEKVGSEIDGRTLGKIKLLQFYSSRDIVFDDNSRGWQNRGSLNLNDEIRTYLESIEADIISLEEKPEDDGTPKVPGGEEYRAQCLEMGVPVPLEFDSGEWVDYGQVPQERVFIVPGLQTTVKAMKSENPKGLCVALPRHEPESAPGKEDGTVFIDGIICMGTMSSKACFWDNQEPNGGFFTFPLNDPPAISTWLGGGDLVGGIGGECSDCHAGENPYIIHPNRSGSNGLGNLLDAYGLELYPDTWHEPHVASVWFKNPVPVDAPRGCTRCHGEADELLKGDNGRLPDVATLKRYCGTILRAAVGARAPDLYSEEGNLAVNPLPTMPPQRPGILSCTPNLDASHPNYRLCNNLTTEVCTPGLPAGADPNTNTVHCIKGLAEFLETCPTP